MWRCQVCDGSDWQRMVNGGFGNSATTHAAALAVAAEALYLVIGNYSTGLEVWRTTDGVDWQQVVSRAWATATARASGRTRCWLEGNRLLVGTWNTANGGEIWSYQPLSVYLPWAIRH